jgi:hypothetical protein
LFECTKSINFVAAGTAHRDAFELRMNVWLHKKSLGESPSW